MWRVARDLWYPCGVIQGWHELGDVILRSLTQVSFVVALLMVGILRFTLPREDRPHIKTPAILLILSTVCRIASVVAPEKGWHKPLHTAADFFVLLSMGRSGFLLLVESYFAQRMSRPLPKIFRDILQGLVYFAVLFATLQSAGVEPGQLLTTSALLTAVIGLSLQDTLGNMFSGLAIQAERPFDKNDWIRYGASEHEQGRILEMNWRAVKVLTVDHVEVTVPNAVLAKAPLFNFSRPSNAARRSVEVELSYDLPPGHAKDLVLAAVAGAPGVLASPPPAVVVSGYGECGIIYSARYFVDSFMQMEAVAGAVRERIWYATHRAGQSLPFPQRHIHTQEAVVEVSTDKLIAKRQHILREVPIFGELPDAAILELARHSKEMLFAAGECIIEQGSQGSELFVILEGQVQVRLERKKKGPATLATLGPGEFFGEMSLLTGEERKASVIAVRASTLISVKKEALQPLLKATPKLAELLSLAVHKRNEALGRRQMSDTGIHAEPSRESNLLLERIRDFFHLK